MAAAHQNCTCLSTGSSFFELPASPFDSLRNSNLHPSDNEAVAIRELISTTEACIARGDSEIARQRARLAQLQASREELVRFAKEHRSILSPVRALPAELLCKIFDDYLNAPTTTGEKEECLDSSDGLGVAITETDTVESHGSSSFGWSNTSHPTDSDESASGSQSGESEYSSSELEEASSESGESDASFLRHDFQLPCPCPPPTSPWIMAHVCRFWREVAISSPRLWSYVHVDLDAGVQNSQAIHDYDTLNARLELAATAPITIDFTCSFDSAEARSMLDALIPHSERWEQATLCVPTTLLHYIEKVEGQVGSLRNITIIYPFPDQFTADVPDIRAFRLAPELNTFNWVPRKRRNEMLPTPIDKFLLPWSQLEHVTLSLIIGPMFMASPELTSTFLNLAECDLTITPSWISPLSPPLQEIRLPLLRRLHFAPSKYAHYSILDALSTPLLETFTMEWAGIPTHSDLNTRRHSTHICEFLGRNHCLTVKFMASRKECDINVSSEVLKHLSDVQELAILSDSLGYNEWGTNMDFASLASNHSSIQDSGPLLPHLTSLTLRTTGMSLYHVLGVVMSRRQSTDDLKVARLQKCVVEDWTYKWAPPRALRRLNRLREQGMDIKVWTVKESWL